MTFYEDASNILLKLPKEFPNSPLKEEATFSAAEVLYFGGIYDKSIELYSNYRKTFPTGYNYQAALYRGALAYLKIDDADGAIFLFQRLYDDFSDGVYASEALINMAEIQTTKKEWASSSAYYRELQQRFPSEASSINSANRLHSLFFRAQGKSSSESALLLDFSKGGGLTKRKGRRAALKLSDLYLNLYRSESNRNKALSWLNELIEGDFNDNEMKSTAYRLKGDDDFRVGNLKSAASNYIEASSLTSDKEKSANILYRAIMTTIEADAISDGVKIYNSMMKKFPKSDWTKKAKLLPTLAKALEEAKNE